MKIRNYILGTSLTALGLGFTVSALAQGIEEVIVTAQKREESSQDIPIAIDVISGDTFIQEGIRDVKDIGKTSTELEINNNNGQATRIGMRGLQQNGFAPTGDTMAAAHLDGIFLGSFWSLNGLMFDLERVEVLAGPQGTLYGRNSAAGAINLISRRPGKEFAADGNIEFGSFSTQRINAGISALLSRTRLQSGWQAPSTSATRCTRMGAVQLTNGPVGCLRFGMSRITTSFSSRTTTSRRAERMRLVACCGSRQ